MNDPDDMVILPRLRTMQIIAGALLAGCTIFLVISLYLVLIKNQGQGQAPARDQPIISLLAVAMLAICAPIAFILPGVIARSALQRIAAGTWEPPGGANPEQFATLPAQLLAVGQVSMLVGMASLEGVAFFGCMAYLQEAQPLALAVPGVAIFLMLLKFPTRNRVRHWLAQQTDRLADMQKS